MHAQNGEMRERNDGINKVLNNWNDARPDLHHIPLMKSFSLGQESAG